MKLESVSILTVVCFHRMGATIECLKCWFG